MAESNVDSAEKLAPGAREIRVFLCYRRQDGAWHADWLYRQLNNTSFADAGGNTCHVRIYYDKTAPGVSDWKQLHFPSLQTSQAVILVCTPGIAIDFSKRGQPDWVYEELRWWCGHRKTAPIVVDTTSEGDRWLPPLITQKWPDINRIDLSKDDAAAAEGTDRNFVQRIRERITGAIRESERRTVFEDLERFKRLSKLRLAALSCAMVLFFVAVGAAVLALRARVLEKEQLDHANQALAAGILSDLDLKRDKSLTSRQRNALWKLATDEAVRAKFVSALSASPEDIARIAPGLGAVSRSLGLQWPSPAEAEKLLSATAAAIGRFEKTTTPSVGILFQALAPELTEMQAQQVLEVVLRQIRNGTDSDVLETLLRVLDTLPAELTAVQAQQALTPLLHQIGETTEPNGLRALVAGLKALVAKLTEAQVQQALEAVLQQIGKSLNPRALKALLEGLETLLVRPTEAQAQQAVEAVLSQFEKATEYDTYKALGLGLQAIAKKLTEAQVQQALEAVLQQIGNTTASHERAISEMGYGLQALAAKLTEAQVQQALEAVLRQMGKSTDPDALNVLGGGLQALVPKLTAAQAQQAFEAVLQQASKTINSDELSDFAAAVQLLPAKLTEAQSQRAIEALLQQIGKSTNASMVEALLKGLAALPAKLTDEQANQALTPVLQQIGETTHAQPVGSGLQVLAGKLTGAQAQQAFQALLQQIGYTNNPPALDALGEDLKALAARLTDVQVQQALETVLRQIGKTAHSDALSALAEAVQPLSANFNRGTVSAGDRGVAAADW
jgi:hypothetical protein